MRSIRSFARSRADVLARKSNASFVLAVHGGAGTMPRSEMTAERECAYREGLGTALRAGYAVLERGGSSLDAVIAAVVVLEDSPLFNAGRGATLNAEGQHEVDAAVMEGARLRAGGVALVRRIRNPIVAARAVMEKTPHVLLAGRAAERFAQRAGVPLAPLAYFTTPERVAALERARAREQKRLHGRASAADLHGTVGAVALDRHGNLAAATSTGGYTNKMAGRIGDSPLVGAGLYADGTCAVSTTGLGEAFIRGVVAYDVAARMRYREETLGRAARKALDRIVALGAEGGLIAVDRAGRVAMPFVSEGMYRGMVRAGRYTMAVYR